jgi:hypothetical protein
VSVGEQLASIECLQSRGNWRTLLMCSVYQRPPLLNMKKAQNRPVMVINQREGVANDRTRRSASPTASAAIAALS